MHQTDIQKPLPSFIFLKVSCIYLPQVKRIILVIFFISWYIIVIGPYKANLVGLFLCSSRFISISSLPLIDNRWHADHVYLSVCWLLICLFMSFRLWRFPMWQIYSSCSLPTYCCCSLSRWFLGLLQFSTCLYLKTKDQHWKQGSFCFWPLIG